MSVKQTKRLGIFSLDFESVQRTCSNGTERQIAPRVDGARKKLKLFRVHANMGFDESIWMTYSGRFDRSLAMARADRLVIDYIS